MDFKRVDVGNATEAVWLLLDDLALEEYRFTIGLREPESEVRVGYAASERSGGGAVARVRRR